MPEIVTITRESSDWRNDSVRTEAVTLKITRDQCTFLLNLVEERQKDLLQCIQDTHLLLDMTSEEANQLYNDKNMCHELSILLNI